MSNLQIREFSQNIINYINSVDLPIEVKRFVIKDIYTQVEIESGRIVNEEIKEKEREVSNNGIDE